MYVNGYSKYTNSSGANCTYALFCYKLQIKI